MRKAKSSKQLVTGLFAVLLTAVIIVAAGCGPAQPSDALSGTVTASGSTALLPLVQVAAEEFMNAHPNVNVVVSGGGSFTGLEQVAAGSVNIGDSDVPAPAEYSNAGLVDHQVAVAPFLIVVNPDVTIDNLTQQQAIDIFTGKITNWKDVGGPDKPIAIIHRAKSSGSRATIKDIVLKGAEFTDKATILNSNGDVRQAISQTPGAIGYIDAAYLDNSVKALKYNGVAYSPENVANGTYPIFAYEHMYTKGEPTGATAAFLQYIMSTDFQNRNVAKAGFLPISAVGGK